MLPADYIIRRTYSGRRHTTGSSKRQNLNRHLFTKFDCQLTIEREIFAILLAPQPAGLFAGVLVCQATSIEFLSNNQTKEK